MKKVTKPIIRFVVDNLDKKIVRLAKCNTIHKDKLITNSFKLLKIEQKIDIDDLIPIELTKKRIEKILNISDISTKDILKLCQKLKIAYFKYKYIACDGLSQDYFNYFNEVTYNQDKEYIRLYISNKILLRVDK